MRRLRSGASLLKQPNSKPSLTFYIIYSNKSVNAKWYADLVSSITILLNSIFLKFTRNFKLFSTRQDSKEIVEKSIKKSIRRMYLRHNLVSHYIYAQKWFRGELKLVEPSKGYVVLRPLSRIDEAWSKSKEIREIHEMEVLLNFQKGYRAIYIHTYICM